MHSMHPAKSPRATWIRRLRVPVMGLLLGLVGAAPMTATAETHSPLPKGYTTDELPTLPPSIQAPPIQQASDVTVEEDEYVDTDPSALTDFREPLAPHGAWVEDPTYGTVWVPSATVVGADFAPYQTAGHWAMTEDEEWVWVSDYEWGYIPFHYGRWVWISGRGWSWIPGRTYAPSWVIWRVSDYGYIGWAPMPPAYYWSGGSAVGLWVVPPAPYVFVSTHHVFHHHVHTHIIHDHTHVKHIAANSRVYKGANASVGAPHSPHKGASAGSASAGRSSYRPASPTLADAKVPKSAGPKARIAPNPKATALSHRSTSPKAKLGGLPTDRGVRTSPGSRGIAAPSDRGIRMAPSDRGSRRPQITLPRGDEPRDRPQSAPVIRSPQTFDGGHHRSAPPAINVPRTQPPPPVYRAEPPPARGHSSPPPQVVDRPSRKIVVPSAPEKSSSPPERSYSKPSKSSSSPPAARSQPAPAVKPTPAPARVAPASRPSSRGRR